MSLDTCKSCGTSVDTDAEPECYLITKKTIDLPPIKQDHECICESCREELSEEELEQRAG